MISIQEEYEIILEKESSKDRETTSYQVHRLSYFLDKEKVVHFLEENSFFPKFYWRSRDQNSERLSLGVLLQSSLPPYHSPLTWYGVYTGKTDSLFVLPEYELLQKEDGVAVAYHSLQEKKTAPLLSSQPKGITRISFTKIAQHPTQNEFINLVNQIKIDNHLHKAVLARKIELIFKKGSFLDLFYNRIPDTHGYLFVVLLSPQKGFLGVSPEQLYKRLGNQITTEALAGTRRRGLDPLEEKQLEEELLNSRKDLQEIGFVEKFLLDTLPFLSQKEPLSCKKLPLLQHLHTIYEGETSLSDRDLLTRMHPTPALGGYPQKEALSFLQNYEPFSREFYGSSVGYSNQNEAEFCVAIRSLFIEKDRANLFAGAGIVNNSSPLEEWDEIEAKVAAILQGFHADIVPE